MIANVFPYDEHFFMHKFEFMLPVKQYWLLNTGIRKQPTRSYLFIIDFESDKNIFYKTSFKSF